MRHIREGYSALVTEATPGEETPPPNPEEVRQSTPFLVLQFFVFPMAIVAVCVTVFVIFGLISSESRTPRQYLAEARSGGGIFNIKRWQAAHALAGVLQSPKDLGAARSDPKFAEEVLELYHSTAKAEGDDVLLRRYLTLVLGRLGDAHALPDLRAAAAEEGGDGQTRVYAIWSLGALGDAQAVPDLVRLAHHEDAGVRKTAVHALGVFATDEAAAALHEATNDAVQDVRWNAALALGRRGDAAAAPVLREMLDRKQVTKALTDADPKQPPDAAAVEEIIVEAARSAATTPDSGLRPLLESLRDGDASLAVREAARAALERAAAPANGGSH
jgi:HEAT repeat protein